MYQPCIGRRIQCIACSFLQLSIDLSPKLANVHFTTNASVYSKLSTKSAQAVAQPVTGLSNVCADMRHCPRTRLLLLLAADYLPTTRTRCRRCNANSSSYSIFPTPNQPTRRQSNIQDPISKIENRKSRLIDRQCSHLKDSPSYLVLANQT